MGRGGEVVQRQQRAVLGQGGGIGGEHVKGCAAQLPSLQRLIQIVLVDDLPTRGVYEDGRWLEMVEQCAVDHILRLGIQMHADGHQIGLLQQRLQRIHLLDAAAGSLLRRNKGVVSHHLHAKGGGHHVRYHLGDITHADKPQRLAGDLCTLHFRWSDAGKRSLTHPYIGAIEVSTHF